MKFDRLKCGSAVILSEDGVTASGQAQDDGSRTVLSQHPIPRKGIFKFSMKVVFRGRGLRIGVCKPDMKLGQSLGNNDASWALSDCGKVRHNKSWKDYFLELKTDVVTCSVNRKLGTISYSING